MTKNKILIKDQNGMEYMFVPFRLSYKKIISLIWTMSAG